MEECESSDNKAGKEITNVSDLDQTHGQPSRESGVLESLNPLNSPSSTRDIFPTNLAIELTSAQIMNEQQITMMFPRLVIQSVPLQPITAESQDGDLKIESKIACLVISVSTTGIVSFLSGNSGSQITTASKLLFKAGILLLFTSLFSALILLILSTTRPNFSCLIPTVRTIMWVSTGLMTLAVVLLLMSYF